MMEINEMVKRMTKGILVDQYLYAHHDNLKQVDLEKQIVIEDETLEDVTIDELRDSLCEHEPRFPISLQLVIKWTQRNLSVFQSGLWPIPFATRMEMATSLTPSPFSSHLPLDVR